VAVTELQGECKTKSELYRREHFLVQIITVWVSNKGKLPALEMRIITLQ
jgi:hypothetical protein